MALAGAPIEFSTGSRYPLWPKCDAFSTGGGKKRKKKEPMVFRFNLSYARNLVHEPTYTRARMGGGERERERRILPFPFWIYHYTLPTINRYICHFTLSFIDNRNVIKTSGF